MIVIVCRTRLFGADLLELAGGYGSVRNVLSTQDGSISEVLSELSSILVSHNIRTVIYEPSCFIDPAPFRTLSPSTRFIVVSAPGEETSVRTALLYGANGVIFKPVRQDELDGVLTLVAQ
ncbi:MAG TPA: hypothetical protein PKH40_02975 [Treponemataceae bacterium]|jgi:hypothetical protein|nr:hypothetical protein [Treponemataceae bacterium]